MRLINLPDVVRVYAQPDQDKAYRLETYVADVVLSGDAVEVHDYGTWFWSRRFVEYQGVEYQIQCDGDDLRSVPSYSTIKSGKCRLVDASDNTPPLSPELQDVLIQRHDPRYRARQTRGDKTWGTVVGMGKRRLVDGLADFAAGAFTEADGVMFAGKAILLDDRVVGYDRRANQLLCLGLELNPLWRFKPEDATLKDYAGTPQIADALVIQNFGPAHASKSPGPVIDGEKQQDFLNLHDGQLIAVELATGEMRWQREVPDAVDDMALAGAQLLVCSVNELHVLDTTSGETQQVIATGLSDGYDRSLNASFIHVIDEYVFFIHQADACILVYALEDFELVKRIDIPEPFTAKEVLNGDQVQRLALIELKSRSAREYAHMSPILEIDLDGLDAEIATVNGPTVTIELRPANDNPEHVEVWVSMRDVPLDEAMLYAEMHLQNQAYFHGRQGAHLASMHITENFNGKVHFEYRGSDRPEGEVEEKLSILQARFAKWASEEAFASTDRVPKEDCSLDVAYVAD
jgi:hypothetical protein